MASESGPDSLTGRVIVGIRLVGKRLFEDHFVQRAR